MRGTPGTQGRAVYADGIIPAHAGNTDGTAYRRPYRRDHPRTCGEHGHLTDQSIHDKGSSPHMRGTRSSHLIEIFSRGIIPAHAGNTLSPSRGRVLVRDHPRTCGEHTANSRYMSRLVGSSPHMRGTLVECDFFRGGHGIIPAHAGNTMAQPLPHPFG